MSVLRVLTYHRVLDVADARKATPGLLSATAPAFARQMEYLARHYRVVTLEQVSDAFAGGRPLPSRATLITFDDGYRDFGEVAWPILKRLGLPVTVFVPTAYPGSGERTFWWDRVAEIAFSPAKTEMKVDTLGRLSLATDAERLQAFCRIRDHVKSLPHEDAMGFVDRLSMGSVRAAASPPMVLDWEELRRLSKAGVAIGPHTRTHPLLSQVPEEQVAAEVLGSIEDIRREIGDCLPVFCYPSGDHNDAVVRVVARCGIEIAVSTNDGHNDLRTVDRLRLRRTSITSRTTPWVFAVRLTRLGAAIDRWRHRPRTKPVSTPPNSHAEVNVTSAISS